ncbi:MAG: CBS domain-containing protein [DPANN group archaeon]|nr:CBS domain-containing protein [DPANN group archaeon]
MESDNPFGVCLFMNGLHLNADAQDSLVNIANLLYRNNANAIIVRKGGVPDGIITAKDIIRGLISIRKSPHTITAEEVMSTPLITIPHDASMSDARERMLQSGVRMLPVENDSEILGLLVASDILKDLSWHQR